MADRAHACLLVIGIGNSLRRDDGAGLLLAAALAEVWEAAGHPVRLLTAHQLAPEHALEVSQAEVGAVLFVDAAVHTAAPTLYPIQPASGDSPAGGHTLGPATVLLYAQLLDPHTRPAWLLTLPAHDLDHGEGLSTATQTYLDSLVADSAILWQRIIG